MTARLILGFALLSASSAIAQSIHTVPRSADNTDGNALFAFPGIGKSFRIQVIVDASELAALQGQQITGVAVRRDTQHSGALPATSGSLVVRIGPAATPAADARPDFSANLPGPIEVYRGPIGAPSSAAQPAGPSWAPTESVHIQFAQPVHYGGGPLCLDFEGTVGQDVWWPVDAVPDPVAGTAVSVGTSCGRMASYGPTADVGLSGLAVGRTATFSLVGQPRATAWLLVGLDLLPSPTELTPIGAPGCFARVNPIATLPTALSGAYAGLDMSGIANVDLHLPNDSGLMGGMLTAQWLELTPPSVVTSNALVCTIAPTAPSLAMTAVVSRAGETPDVQSAAVPVLGLIWQ